MNPQQVVQGVIQQFSERAACLRELVQNAIDAETDRVEVRFEREDPWFIVAVEDYGCGMTLADVDRYLLNVFKSSKEGDLESIGKFGIGFVSIFALKPAFVGVETSRDGESTRIVIDRDLSIQYFRGEPRVGTRVALYLELPSEAAFSALTTECVDFLRRTCRYVDVELALWRDGDETLLNEPLALDLPLTAAWREGPDEILIGYGDAWPTYVLMNRRLVLEQGQRELLPGLSVVATSREIEHNLARNAVIQDRGFERFMGRVRALAEEELFPQLLSRVRAREGGAGTLRAAGAIARHPKPESPFGKLQREPLFEVVRAGERRWVSPAAASLEGPVAVAADLSRLAEAVSGRRPVVISTPQWPAVELLKAMRLQTIPVESLGASVEAAGVELPLAEGVPVRILGLGADRVALRLPAVESVWDQMSPSGPHLGVNVDHPVVRRILGLSDAGLAAQLLTRALEVEGLLSDGSGDAALDAWLTEVSP